MRLELGVYSPVKLGLAKGEPNRTNEVGTLNLEVSKLSSGTEVEDDVIVKDVPCAVFTSWSKPSRMLHNLCLASRLKNFDTPFLVENIEVDSTTRRMGVLGQDR